MLLLTVDRHSDTPVFQQIRDRIISLIEQGALLPGDCLPPTRVLASDLGVHRSTVVRAYDDVRALGLLEGRSGAYTTVRKRERDTIRVRNEKSPCRLDWANITSSGIRKLGTASPTDASPPEERLIDMDRLAPDPRLSPTDEVRRCVRRVLLGRAQECLDYAPAAGHPSLREAIARRLASHGVEITADEIMITAGAQQAIDLILRLLVQPGDRVALEAPSYSMFHRLVELHGAQPLYIPMETEGMNLDRLAGALRQRPRLLYTMPNFQNPTGATTGPAHRERLLSLCEEAAVPILEDGFEEEMKYYGRAVLPLKSMDSGGAVLYVGSFSKVVFPGLRLGWIAAPAPAIGLLTTIQHTANLSVNSLSQVAAARFCRQGDFDAYLRRIHRHYRKRMQAMLQGLDTCLPEGSRWTRPNGGYTVWLQLPVPVEREEEIRDRALAAGVRIAPGSRFFDRAQAGASFRLSIACADVNEITAGCKRLGQVIDQLGDRNQGPSRYPATG